MASNLGGKVTTSVLTISDIVQRMWGTEFTAPDHGVYEFAGRSRKFDSTDRGRTGIYGVEVTDGLLIDNAASRRYPDVYPGAVLDELGDKLAQDHG